MAFKPKPEQKMAYCDMISLFCDQMDDPGTDPISVPRSHITMIHRIFCRIHETTDIDAVRMAYRGCNPNHSGFSLKWDKVIRAFYVQHIEANDRSVVRSVYDSSLIDAEIAEDRAIRRLDAAMIYGPLLRETARQVQAIEDPTERAAALIKLLRHFEVMDKNHLAELLKKAEQNLGESDGDVTDDGDLDEFMGTLDEHTKGNSDGS